MKRKPYPRAGGAKIEGSMPTKPNIAKEIAQTLPFRDVRREAAMRFRS
jgi:hypothetical protein